MESNNLFNKNQFGFRKTQSATSAILEMVSKILESLENGDITMTIMTDLTKAFDCVPVDLLIEKLKMYHFDKYLIEIIESYLTDR